MAVSVRMEPSLELELERAARQLGLSKSQFIIDAVERALGRKDPYKLLQEAYAAQGLTLGEAVPPARAARKRAGASSTDSMRNRLREKLRAQHEADTRDWLAYQEAKRRGETWVPDPAPPRSKG